MARITLILGGARSGKSRYAERMARTEGGDRVLFVATAQALDAEMAARIRRHRAERPSTWHTLEAPQDLAQALATQPDAFPVTIVDCLTLWVSNLLGGFQDPQAEGIRPAVEAQVAALLAVLRQRQGHALLISNEVGLGLVPPYPLGRVYRDLLGEVNQWVAQEADQVVFMVAGLPMYLKGGPT